jgi:hypothetical protein
MIIKFQKTNKALSSFGGMLCFKDIHKHFDLNAAISPFLPQLITGSARNFRKFEGLMFGLEAGAECLDDMDRLAMDQGFAEVCHGKVYTAKAYGDFLRSFSEYQCKLLNRSLVELGYKLRSALFSQKDSITIDFDSTSNQQYGKKMDGVELNYKGINCLDTIAAFDEHGIQYWHDVRPGNTFTSSGCGEIVHAVFAGMPKNLEAQKIKRFVRADSGFCNLEFFNACFAKNAGFVVTMRENIFRPLLKNIGDWQTQNAKDDERIKFYDSRECEIGETLYAPKDCPKVMRVVVIRALKKELEGKAHLFFHEDNYDYYAWVSSIGDHEKSAEKLIKFYRKRGQMENYIKEHKYGFDLKHYPCLKLIANKAYGLITAFAYNFMRALSLLDNPKKPQYAKAIRFRVIHKPVQIVRHARQVVFQFMTNHFEEVKRWLEKIKNIQLGIAISESAELSDAL